MSNFREDINKKDFINQFNTPIEIIEKLGKGTFKYIINDTTKIRLYETDIIIFKNNSVILNTGGFYTNLTRNRINDNIPIGVVFQKNNIWYFSCNRYDNKEGRFFDGMEIDNSTGNILNKDKAPKFFDIDKYNKKINKMIKAYCIEINKKDLPLDSSGDCLYCQFNKCSKDNEHLLLHLKEKYVMKSLILTALQEKGYRFPIFVYRAYQTDRNKSAITRAVTQYFRERLLKK